jgi:hypothetical protein
MAAPTHLCLFLIVAEELGGGEGDQLAAGAQRQAEGLSQPHSLLHIGAQLPEYTQRLTSRGLSRELKQGCCVRRAHELRSIPR